MKWGIIVDSSCDYVAKIESNSNIYFSKIPFVLTINETEYRDDETLDLSSMLDHMENYKKASFSSCPGPGVWQEEFDKADNIIAITISSNLSGSYNSAMSAREIECENNSGKNIYVLDSKSAGSELGLCVEKALELIQSGLEFCDVAKELQDYSDKLNTIFALCSFDNLIKNGRMNRVVGVVAKVIGMWGIGIASDKGTIIVKEKALGTRRVIAGFIRDMQENNFDGGKVLISHCQNLELSEKLRDQVLMIWPNAVVEIVPAKGLCSYYAERGGLIVAY